MMSPLSALLLAEARSARHGWFRADPSAQRFRRILLIVGLLVFGIIFGVSARIFHHLLITMPEAAELGVPLVLRLIEMAHLLFFVMLFISSLSVTLSVLYLDPEVPFLTTTPLPSIWLYLERSLAVILRASWFVIFAAIAMFLAHSIIGGAPSRAAHLAHSLGVLALFIIPPSAIGIAGTALIVRFLPIRRAKTALLLLSVVSLSVIIIASRWMMPERFLKPKMEEDFRITLAASLDPAAPGLPSAWAAASIVRGDSTSDAKLALLSAGSLALALFALGALHRRGLDRVWSERTVSIERGRWSAIDRLLESLPHDLALIARKDLRVFWRDPAQWSQLIVLLALVVIYAFNFRQIKGEIGSFFLRDAISFVNLGMAGFVLVAVANRFVFSAVSMEGRAIWVLRSSPLDLRRILVSKAAVAFFPLLILTEAITLLANHALEVSTGFQFASALVILLMTITVTSMGIGLGALAPRFDLKDPAQIGMTQSGILFMGIGLAYVVAFTLCLAAHLVITWRYHWLKLENPPILLQALPVAAAVVVNLAAMVLPWKSGMEKIRALQVTT